jgi:hypothetical protein
MREFDGTIRVLVDGGNPRLASLNLVNVNARAVSYDGHTIVFAGLPAGNPLREPGRAYLQLLGLTQDRNDLIGPTAGSPSPARRTWDRSTAS